MTAVYEPLGVARRGPLLFEARKRILGSGLSECALILAGATCVIPVLGYTLTGLSAVCMLVAPAILLVRLTPGTAWVLALACLGCASYGASALVNGVAPSDQRVLQWASFALYFSGFVVLAGRSLTRIFALTFGIAVGSIVFFAVVGFPLVNVNTFEDKWKYGYAPFVSLALLYLLIRFKATLAMQIAFMVALAGFSLSQNFRSHALVCFFVASALFVGWVGKRLHRGIQMLALFVLAYLTSSIVTFVAESGLAGQSVQLKQQSQEVAGVPVILAGRTESPLSIAAIMDRPILGWGSADLIPPAVFEHGKSLAITMGFDPSLPIESMWRLPNGSTSLHSVFLTSWAEGGVFAALLPGFLFVAALTIVWNVSRYGVWAAPALLMSAQALWDLLFSPINYNLLPMLAILATVFAARNLTGRRLTHDHQY